MQNQPLVSMASVSSIRFLEPVLALIVYMDCQCLVGNHINLSYLSIPLS